MEDMSGVMVAAAVVVGGYLLGRLRASLRASADAAPDVPPPPVDRNALELARRILPVEGKIAAIKAYREATGVGLRDAKLVVDSLED